MSDKLFPIKDLLMINSCLANSPGVYIYTVICTLTSVIWPITFKTAATENVTDDMQRKRVSKYNRTILLLLLLSQNQPKRSLREFSILRHPKPASLTCGREQ